MSRFVASGPEARRDASVDERSRSRRPAGWLCGVTGAAALLASILTGPVRSAHAWTSGPATTVTPLALIPRDVTAGLVLRMLPGDAPTRANGLAPIPGDQPVVVGVTRSLSGAAAEGVTMLPNTGGATR